MTTMPSPDSLSDRGPAPLTKTVLFDTNVWLDYFLGREETVDDIVRLIEAAKAAHDDIVTTAAIKKDVFYILPRELRRIARAQGHDGHASSESTPTLIAWAALDQIDALTTLVSLGMREDFLARHFKDVHGDYEDNTLVATARSIGAKFFVTSDAGLIEHFPDLCLTPAQALGTYTT